MSVTYNITIQDANLLMRLSHDPFVGYEIARKCTLIFQTNDDAVLFKIAHLGESETETKTVNGRVHMMVDRPHVWPSIEFKVRVVDNVDYCFRNEVAKHRFDCFLDECRCANILQSDGWDMSEPISETWLPLLGGLGWQHRANFSGKGNFVQLCRENLNMFRLHKGQATSLLQRIN